MAHTQDPLAISSDGLRAGVAPRLACGAKIRGTPGTPNAKSQYPMPNAQCPMPNKNSIPNVQCLMANGQCPWRVTRTAQCPGASCPAQHAGGPHAHRPRMLYGTAAAQWLYMSAQRPALLLGRLPSGRRRRPTQRAVPQKLGARRLPASGDLMTPGARVRQPDDSANPRLCPMPKAQCPMPHVSNSPS